MGAGASTDFDTVDIRSLTAIHLPSTAEVTLEESPSVKVASSNAAGLLLNGDKLIYVRKVRVQSHRHACMLLSGANHSSSDVLRVVVQRVLSSEATLKRPAESEKFRYGLHMRTLQGGPTGSTVEVIGVEGFAASTGAIAVGSEILTVNGQEARSSRQVAELLHSVEAGATAALALRHPPRMAPPRMHLSLDRQGLAIPTMLPEKASVEAERVPTARIGDVSPPDSARLEEIHV